MPEDVSGRSVMIEPKPDTDNLESCSQPRSDLENAPGAEGCESGAPGQTPGCDRVDQPGLESSADQGSIASDGAAAQLKSGSTAGSKSESDSHSDSHSDSGSDSGSGSGSGSGSDSGSDSDSHSGSDGQLDQRPEVHVESDNYHDQCSDENLVEVEKNLEQPALTLKEAAVVLGKSMRALERSLHGKWGNKLPDGWTAKKVMVDGAEEWRVYPPAGFNFKIDHLFSEIRKSSNNGRKSLKEEFLDYFKPEHGPPPKTNRSIWTKSANELVLGRPLEVVQLLRELAMAQKALAEEHRAHLEDLKLLAEAQSTMRLLEVNQVETARLKEDLVAAQSDLIELKRRYDALVNLPWWKRIFIRRP